MQTIEIKINGMTCMGCVTSLTNVLDKISGVSHVAISLDQALATIQYDSEICNVDQFRKSILDAGFEVIN